LSTVDIRAGRLLSGVHGVRTNDKND
jgi:hypothetical protein